MDVVRATDFLRPFGPLAPEVAITRFTDQLLGYAASRNKESQWTLAGGNAHSTIVEGQAIDFAQSGQAAVRFVDLEHADGARKSVYIVHKTTVSSDSQTNRRNACFSCLAVGIQ